MLSLSDLITPSLADMPAGMSGLKDAAGDAVALLRALANSDRLMLLCQLVDGEQCVSDLSERTGIHQPTLSQQLGVLRDEGLVATRRDGKFVHYRLASAHAVAVLKVLHALYCPAASKGKPHSTERKNVR